jgi:hypothetical protein
MPVELALIRRGVLSQRVVVDVSDLKPNRKSQSAEASAANSERSRRAILRRTSQGFFQSPTKNPAVAVSTRRPDR